MPIFIIIYIIIFFHLLLFFINYLNFLFQECHSFIHLMRLFPLMMILEHYDIRKPVQALQKGA